MYDPILWAAGQAQAAAAAREAWRAQAALRMYEGLIDKERWKEELLVREVCDALADEAIMATDALMARLERRS